MLAFTRNTPPRNNPVESPAFARGSRQAPHPTKGPGSEPGEANDVAGSLACVTCLHELFEAQVEAKPRAIALVVGPVRMTYRELNLRANRMARHLRSLGVGRETLVGIFLERSADMLAAMLGVLKAGGAYVPLDPAYPPDRLAFMLEDARVRTVLTQSSLLAKLRTLEFAAGSDPRPVCVDTDRELAAASDANPEPLARANNLAYVIYTSGSSGQPKGVALEHHNVVSFVRWAGQIYSPRELDGMLGSVSLSFDPSIIDLFVPLSLGGKIILAADTLALADLAAAAEVRVITSVPSVVKELLRVGGIPPSVETVNLGGEPLSVQLVEQLHALPHIRRVYDLYGPTETTTCSTYALRAAGKPATIGRPIARTQVYLLDEHMQPVPTGDTGELFIGGEGVARGYLNRPGITAEKFIQYTPAPGRTVRVYRTGDLCRRRPDGNLEFVGRRDQQVKIRGFRIELGEVESVLRAHPAVGEAIVIAQEDTPDQRRLVAYVVPRTPRAPGPLNAMEPSLVPQLRAHLLARLPDFMVPGAFVLLERFDLTPNGKVNRATLPAPVRSRAAVGEFHAPRTATEIQLGKIWTGLLGLEEVGVQDDFFQIGGDSLLGISLLAEIQGKAGVKLPVEVLLRAPTLERLAASIDELIQARPQFPDPPWVEIQPPGSRPRLFLVHGVGGGMLWGYANLARHLGPDQPVHVFKACSPDRLPEFDTIEKMAAQYVQDLRRLQPEGPYALGGYCFGGNVAYAMARLLVQQGQQVGLLALLNSSPPNSSYDRVDWTLQYLGRFLRNLGFWLVGFVQWGPAKQWRFLRWKTGALKKRAERWLGAVRRPGGPAADELVDLSLVPRAERCLWESHVRALGRHQTQPYDGRVVLLRTPGHPLNCSYDPQCGWGSLVSGGVVVRIIPGLHESLLEEPYVRRLADELKHHLDTLTPQITKLP